LHNNDKNYKKNIKRRDRLATKFCPHCGEKNGFQVNFNIVCRIGDKEEKGYLRTCKDCGGRFITIQKDERITEVKEEISSNGR
jgi:transcription elongation factor Elf1